MPVYQRRNLAAELISVLFGLFMLLAHWKDITEQPIAAALIVLVAVVGIGSWIRSTCRED